MNPTLISTNTVLINVENRIKNQLFEIISDNVITPTPAGIKKREIFFVNNVEMLFILRGSIILKLSAKKNKTIPMTLPGMLSKK